MFFLFKKRHVYLSISITGLDLWALRIEVQRYNVWDGMGEREVDTDMQGVSSHHPIYPVSVSKNLKEKKIPSKLETIPKKECQNK